MSHSREFIECLLSMTEDQQTSFVELLELIDGDPECMDAALDYIRENGVDGVHAFVRQFKEKEVATV